MAQKNSRATADNVPVKNAGKDCQGDGEKRPRVLATAAKGVKTSTDFSCFMSDLMSDVIEGSINPNVANSAINAGGKLLKIVEMQLKYGKANVVGGQKVLPLLQKDES